MTILVENGSYSLGNHGDAAMLIVAFNRLRELWPDTSIAVITSEPARLQAYCPGAVPVIVRYPIWWRWLGSAARRLAPAASHRHQSVLESWIKRRWPAAFKRVLREAVAAAEIVVHSGAGVITDEFESEALQRLNLFQEAVQAGKPTAMFSQGIGPLNSSRLRALTRSVLPSVQVIGLREDRISLPLLMDLGVSRSSVMTTGDDAIELAHAARASALGDQIGVNLRMTPYARLSVRDSGLIGSIRRALKTAEARHDASLTPLPTAPGDESSILTVLNRQNERPEAQESDATLFEMLERINRCRVVVTGSYHAAVFALAQGTAAICLARSAYYSQKFTGLADLFGTGCDVLILDDADLPEKLEAAIDEAWRLSKDARPQLLEAARQQIEASQKAYQVFGNLVIRGKGLTNNEAKP